MCKPNRVHIQQAVLHSGRKAMVYGRKCGGVGLGGLASVEAARRVYAGGGSRACDGAVEAYGWVPCPVPSAAVVCGCYEVIVHVSSVRVVVRLGGWGDACNVVGSTSRALFDEVAY